MKGLFKVATFLIVLTTLACGEFQADPQRTQQQAAVFGKREALQTRTGLKAKLRLSSQPLQGVFQSAMLARGAGKLIVNAGGNCRPQNSLGSGQLVGDRTMVTAVHVVGGVETNITAAIEGGLDTVNFADPTNAFQGIWYADSHVGGTNDNDWLAGVESDWLNWGAHTKREESPLLAERLFQLSFHGTGFNTDSDPSYNPTPDDPSAMRQLRNGLRSNWPFKRDFVGRTAAWDDLAVNFKQDITVIQAQDIRTTPVFVDYFPAMRNNLGNNLVLNAPAVFFNRSDFREEDDKASDTPYAVLLQSMHLHNSANSFISSIFTTGLIHKEWGQISVPMPYCTSNDTLQTVPVILTKSTLDALGGSSGGGVTTCNTPNCERRAGDNTTSPERFAMLETRGVLSTINDLLAYNTWGGEEPEDDENVYSAVSMVTKDSLKAVWPENENQLITCYTRGVDCPVLPACLYNDPLTGACIYWDTGGIRANESFGAPPPNPILLSMDVEDDGEVIAPNLDDADVREYQRNFRVNCNRYFRKDEQFRNGKPEYVHGALVGFRGFPAANLGGTSNTSSTLGIGSIAPICSVYDVESYTSNWHAIRGHGPASSADLASQSLNEGRPPKRPYNFLLYRSLNTEFYRERFGGIDDYVDRPAPTKLCPPNHLLMGVDVQKENGVLVRIAALECVRTDINASMPQRSRMPLWVEGTAESNYQYTVQGERYSLSQRIGSKPEGTVQEVYNGCSEGEVAYEVQVLYDANDKVEGLWFGCMPNPSLATP